MVQAMYARIAFSLAAAIGMAGCVAPSASMPLADAAPARQAWVDRCSAFDEWDKPGPPFRIYGQTYYVGTCGISSILIAAPDGLILIDSGTDEGAKIVLDNIRSLGFDPRDVAVILMSHEHFDHVGGMARLQAATGATVVASEAAIPVLRSGMVSPQDPQAKSGHPAFPPVTGETRAVGDYSGRSFAGRTFFPIATPGHTLGATSWRWQDCEEGVCKTIVYVDSLNPISSDDYRFSDHPDLVTAFRAGIENVATSECDIVLAPHPGATKLRDRLAGTAPLIDPDRCAAYARGVGAKLDARLAAEDAGNE